ncbi:TolC family protein [Rhizobium lemnae]|uniref:TolC family protein n=1 Tax=Rhizobium lemnae TaxID=1214924 RepID=A0ABV8E6N7_9HYPH|nr:TolC family protein [Rhizobium lemnae]MCJ8510368.1 TolC family protein [Rhizobium lemnae]
MRAKQKTALLMIAARFCAAFACILFTTFSARGQEERSDFSQFQLRLNQDSALRTLADAQLRLATADFLPKVNMAGEGILGGRIEYSPDITVDNPGTYAKRDPSTAGLEVSWKLFDGFQNINNLRAAREGVSYALYASLDTRQRLYLEKAEKLLDVIRARAMLAAYNAAVEKRQEASSLAKRLLTDRVVTLSQSELAASELQRALAAQKQAIASLQTAELSYVQFSGSRLGKRVHIEVPTRKLPTSAQQAAERAQAQNPQVQMAYHLEREAEYKARAAAGRYLPTVSLVGRYSRAFDTTPQINRVDNSAILVRATVPIFDPTIGPTADIARTQALQRRWDRQDATLALGMEARKQFELFKSANAQLQDIQRQQVRAKAAVAAMRMEIEAGERTVSDLLDAQQMTVQAALALADAHYVRSVSAFRLLATMGILDLNDIGLDAVNF